MTSRVRVEAGAGCFCNGFCFVQHKANTEPQNHRTTTSHPPVYLCLRLRLRLCLPTTASISKSRYVYYGRHSEGNRFIRDRDL